jgi:hypothetical protein
MRRHSMLRPIFLCGLFILLSVRTSCVAQEVPGNPLGNGSSRDNRDTPNQWFDIQKWGGYIGGSEIPSGACTVTAASRVLRCSNLADFAAGHGISIPTAGPPGIAVTPGAAVKVVSISVSENVARATTQRALGFANGSEIVMDGSTDPAFNGKFVVKVQDSYNSWTFQVKHENCSPNNNPCAIGQQAMANAVITHTVSSQGRTGGATVYNYKVANVSFNGGISAASQVFTTATGPSVLGLNKISITSYSRSSGITTFVCAMSPCNIEPGVEVNIAYVGGARDPSIECPCTVYRASSESFTILQVGLRDVPATPINYAAEVIAKNLVRWVMQPGAVMQSLIWRCVGSLSGRCALNSNYALAGITQGMDSSFTDWGFSMAAVKLPQYYPKHPPLTATDGILATRITKVEGATIMVEDAASASIQSAVILHDNTPNILAICKSGALGGLGGTILLSQGNARGGQYVFNSPLPMMSCPPYTKLEIGMQVLLNAPWLSRSGWEIEGLGEGSGNNIPSFATDHTALIRGTAYPLILIGPGNAISAGGGTLTNLTISVSSPYQSGIFFDQDNGGSNATQWYFRNVYTQGAYPSQPFKLAGGFGFYWDRGSIAQSGATAWGNPPALLDIVDQGIGANSQQLAGIVNMDKTYLGGAEFLFDAAGVYPLGSGPGHMTFNELLNESTFYPTFRFNTGSNHVFAIDIIHATYADPLGGNQAPLIDLTNANVVSGLRIIFPFCNQGPIFAGLNQGGVELWNGSHGCSNVGLKTYIAHNEFGSELVDDYSNASIQLNGNGQIYYAMSMPPAPSLTISGNQGPPAGTYYYKILGHDINGNSTGPSPVSPGITVNGAQGIKLSWELVPGQDSTTICRGLEPERIACVSTGSGFRVRGTSYVDGPTIYPNASQPWVGKAGSASLGRNGVAAPTATTGRLNQFGANELAGVASCENSTRSIIFKIKYNFPPVVLVADETTKGGVNVTAKSESGFTVSCSGASDTFDWQAIGNPN